MAEIGSLARSFAFDGKSLVFWERDGEHYVTAKEIADALGYADASKVTTLYSRRKSEFRESESCTLKVRDQRNGADPRAKLVRVFSARGAMRVAILAETEKAAAFRDFCLDVMDKLRTGAALVNDPAALMARIATLENELATSRASHVRALEIGMDTVSSMSKEIASLLGYALGKRGAQKKAERKLLGEIKNGQRFLVDPSKPANRVFGEGASLVSTGSHPMRCEAVRGDGVRCDQVAGHVDAHDFTKGA